MHLLKLRTTNATSGGLHVAMYRKLPLFISRCIGRQTRSSAQNYVCLSVWPSVCLSVSLSVRLSLCQTRDLWQKRVLSANSYTAWKRIYSSLVTRRMISGERPFLPKTLGQPAPVGANSPILKRYSLVAPQRLHLTKKH